VKREEIDPLTDSANIQVLRSVGEWSFGVPKENSIQTAYLDLISKSEHFIYIENQFFISKTIEEEHPVQNKIALALINRISLAITNNQVFRVYILIPEHPEEICKGVGIEQLMYWEYRTIFGKNSIFSILKSRYPNTNISNFITFHSLRKSDEIAGKLVTEQIYVHSSLMIVDDKVAIIGSANINDRSMVGDRNSEIAVIVSDQQFVEAKFNGNSVPVSSFIQQFRIKLFREHLGLPETDSSVWDPVCDQFYHNIWRQISSTNSDIFKNVFKRTRHKNISFYFTFKHCRKSNKDKHLLANLRGHLVNFSEDSFDSIEYFDKLGIALPCFFHL